MDFNGNFMVNLKLDDVRKFFGDINNVIPCLPGIYDINIDKEINCKLKLNISEAGISSMNTISGKMNFKYNLNENNLGIIGTGRIAGSKIKFNIDINMIPDDSNTKIEWHSSFDFGIIVKMMGKNKINAISLSNINNTIECFKNKLNDI